MTEKPQMSSSTNINDWVKAYLDDDTIDLSKAKKFQHLQRVSQFGAFCYLVENNSKQAHIDFFDANYTHMDTQVAKAAEFISRMLQIKYTKFPLPLTSADFHSVNTAMKLFRTVTPEIVDDYLKLAEDFDEHIPHYPNAADTANMLKGLNDDMPDVKSDHIKLLNTTGASKEGKGSLKREEIYGLLDVATETVGGIWQDAKKEKSAAEKTLMKEQEAAVGRRVDVGIKTAKVGLLGAAGVGCIGAVVSGIFLPALGLIPVFVLAKKWLPDFAKSIGSLYENYKKRVAARYSIKKAETKLKYIEKGPAGLTWAENNVMLSHGDKLLLDKQRKSFHMFYGKNSIKEMTMDYLNLGQLENPKELDNMVPADVRAMLNGKVKAFGPKSTYSDLLQTAQMIKTFEPKLPEVDRIPIKQEYAKNAASVIERLVFSEEIGSLNSYQTTAKEYLLGENSEIRKLLSVDPNIERRIRNFYAFADKEHVGMTNPHESLEDFVKTAVTAASIPADSDLVDSSNASVLAKVRGLQRDWGTSNSTYKNAEYFFIEPGTNKRYTLEEIRKEIREILNPADKKKIEDALVSQMEYLFKSDKRDYTIKAMDILRKDGTDGAKNDFVELLKEIGELKFEDFAGGKVGELYQKILKTNPKTSAQPMDLYLLTRHRLAMQELCVKKLDSLAASTPEIKDIRDFMLTINNTPYVDEYHKQDIMAKSIRLFRTYIKNNEYEFKTNLSKTSDLLKSLSELTMLTSSQRDEIIALVIPHLDPAIASNINDLKSKFASEYDSKTYYNLIRNYSVNGGLKDLFEGSTDPSVIAVRDKLEYLRGLESVKIGLDVGNGMTGKKDWNTSELEFVTERFFAKENRKSNDNGLRQFIEGVVKNIDIDYKDPSTNKISADNIINSKGYKQLVNALTFVQAMPHATPEEQEDKFAALILLKNKCVAMFRDCIKKFVQEGVMSGTFSEDTWIRNNQPQIQTMMANWQVFMEEIDKEMDKSYFSSTLKAESKFKTVKELGKYTGSRDFISAYEETGLAR